MRIRGGSFQIGVHGVEPRPCRQRRALESGPRNCSRALRRRSRSCCRLRGWLVQGRSLRGVPWRNGHFATRKHALIGEATRSVPAMAVDLMVACAKYGIMEPVRYCGDGGRGPDRLSSAAAGLGDGEVATAPGQEASRSIYRDRFLAAAAFLTGISEIRQW